MSKREAQSENGQGIALSDRLSVRIPVAVQMTGISRTKLYELIKNGEVPIIKVGKATVIPVEGLKQFIASNCQRL